jgi:hydroxymethylbilane synthase
MSGVLAPARRVVLAAHGAGDDSPANQQVRALAESVASAITRSHGSPGEDARVGVAFRLGTPTFHDAFAQTPTAPLRVVPLMTSDGYFSRDVLQGALAHARPHAPATLAPPIGLDPRVRDLLVRPARQRLTHTSAEHAAVLVVAHGTTRSLSSASSAFALAGDVRAALPEVLVRTAFLDQSPSIEAVAARLTARSLLVVPFLIGGGSHALADVPQRVRAALPDAAIDSLEPLLHAPEVAAIVASWALAPIGERPIRLGTRGSALALRQASLAQSALASLGTSSEIVALSTEGDRDLTTPLSDLPRDAVFARDIREALLRDEIDVAVHSLKDLPATTDDARLTIAAMLPRASTREAFVSRGGVRLDGLPQGALVGTCSTRRTHQLLRLRPDLRIAPIRGDVPSRIAQVRSGRFDATILALAGLERLSLAHEAAQVFDAHAMLPEAGQGVIALETRRDDWLATALCARADDPATRLAATAERAFAQRVEQVPSRIAAGVCEWGLDGGSLHARVFSRDGRLLLDQRESSGDPHALADALAHALPSTSPTEPHP